MSKNNNTANEIEVEHITSGDIITIIGQPCKINKKNYIRGSKKNQNIIYQLVGHNIFNGECIEQVYSYKNMLDITNIEETEYTLINIDDDNYVMLMDDNNATREDLKLPTYPEDYALELYDEFKKGKQLSVTVVKACDQEQIMTHKNHHTLCP